MRKKDVLKHNFSWSVMTSFLSLFTWKLKNSQRTQICILVVVSVEKLNIIPGKFLPCPGVSLSGQSGHISLCQWALVLWMKGSLVPRITETLLKTNVPQLTNGGKKVGLEEYSNINS